MTTSLRRMSVLAAISFSLVPLLWVVAGPAKQQVKTETFTGKVVPLSRLLDKFGAKLDAEAAPHWLALLADDGKVYPLIRDDGSRMFFKDERLLDRPMQLSGKLYPHSQLLQVLSVNSVVRGQLHEVYYWCDICSIKRFEKKACDCCGGPMELKEVPVKK